MRALQRIEWLAEQGNTFGLCHALRHRNPLVRRRAAQALGDLGDPAGVGCLARALRRDTDQYVQRWAIEALGKIGSPEAVDVLTGHLFGTQQTAARLAAQALAGLDRQEAQAALALRDALFRSDWETLEAIGPEARRPLAVILRSEQYAAWPSAKAQRVLDLAIRLEVSPPARHRDALADMGLFMSGVHTLADLFAGLSHRNPRVRIAAAERLAATGRPWLARRLYRRFQIEYAAGERQVAAALARALEQFGDERVIVLCREQLRAAGGHQASEAAYLLAAIGTQAALETLFWYAAEPPPPPVYRNVPLALSALQQAGPAVVDALLPLLEHESPPARRLMVDVVVRSQHPRTVDLLEQLGRDSDPAVQQAALRALAALNSAGAAQALFGLAGSAPPEQVAAALASITHPDGPRCLRQLDPAATTLEGVVFEARRQPVAGVQVQILQEQLDPARNEWRWEAVSPVAETDHDGMFWLAVLAEGEPVRLRLRLVEAAPGKSGKQMDFAADLSLQAGQSNRLEVQIDRFLRRLVITPSDRPSGGF